jgi:YhcH/YjgK/YiaL family protein
MIHGHIDTPETYQPFLDKPAWQTAIDWLKNNQDKPNGEYEINGRDIYATVSTVTTKPRQDCIFEAHQKYIDIHFCLTGGELIEWEPLKNLKPAMEFDGAKDYCLYEAPAKSTSLKMTPGTIAIFLPQDAHMPKIQDGENTEARKVVIKIIQSIV